MTGTPSQGQLRYPRGAVGRQPAAKSRPEAHEAHEGGQRRARAPRDPKPPEAQKSSRSRRTFVRQARGRKVTRLTPGDLHVCHAASTTTTIGTTVWSFTRRATCTMGTLKLAPPSGTSSSPPRSSRTRNGFRTERPTQKSPPPKSGSTSPPQGPTTATLLSKLDA